MTKVLRAGLWIAGDLPYLVILWVVYGIFFPGSNIVAVSLLARYLLIWPFARRSLLAFAAVVFVTSLAVYVLPFYLSTAPVLVGIRDGTMGSISAHWGIGAFAALVATAGLVAARLFTGKFLAPKSPGPTP